LIPARLAIHRKRKQVTVDFQKLTDQLGNTDVYLIDQMMKGRYRKEDTILDAGCGHGRNIDLFIQAGFNVYGVDHDPEKIAYCQAAYPALAGHFTTEDLRDLSFGDGFFHHIISSAVFHFCASTDHFFSLFAEHVRVLRPGGTFFIRMTSSFGLPQGLPVPLGEGRYHLPDYGDRFLITYPLIARMTSEYPVTLLEPVKTVNVRDQRAMAVLVMQKKA
jgi:SAM-dependent methyltransferase